MKNPKKILITGANSGLGWALAEEYSKEGVILFLIGRKLEKLREISKICRERGAEVIEKVIDVRDGKKMSGWIENIGKEIGLDLVIANAGISAGTAGGMESEKQVRDIFSTNIDGVINTINPVIEVMQNQEKCVEGFRGQVVIISSLAGFRGLPSSPAYSASKACVRVYGEGLRGSLARIGITVNVVCPGYIRTPMTDVNDFPMPLLMKASKAAMIIKRSLEKNKSRIAFPFLLYFVVWLSSLISTTITDPIFARLPGKKGMGEVSRHC